MSTARPTPRATPALVAEPALEMIESPPAKVVFQALCLVNALVCTVVLAVALGDAMTSSATVAWGAAGLLTGLLAADLASGLVHWACDTYGSERTPLVGPLFIKLFRVHHDDPLNITRTDFIRINGDNSMLAGAFLLAIIGLRAVDLGPTGPFALGLIITFGLGVTFTNMFHKWSHQRRPPAIARFMHRWRLAIPPAVHQRHHQAPHRSDYCITFGWLNPVLERVGFFRRAEAAIARVGQLARKR